MPTVRERDGTPPQMKTKIADTAPVATSPVPTSPEVRADIPATPAPVPVIAVAPAAGLDAATWAVVKDTTDVTALQRFIAQFPDSPLRGEAEKRIAELTAEQVSWNLVKDSKDPDQLRRFVEQFPDSPERAIAEQRIASLSMAPPKPAVSNAPDPHDLTRLLQVELTRVGCFNGTVSGDFDDATKVALQRFIKLRSLRILTMCRSMQSTPCARSTSGFAPWCARTANTPVANYVLPIHRRRQSAPRRGLRLPLSLLLRRVLRPELHGIPGA